jgi:hypothetical protein
MPYSYSSFKDVVVKHLIENFNKDIFILDVGAGCGTYGKLLYNYFENIHAIEIYPKYLEMFKFEQWYDKVFIEDIKKFDYTNYDLLIMGDVIEHLYVEDAQKLISDIHEKGKMCLVTVPYLFEQGEEYGNIHEIHHQDDLTPELMKERYPQLKLLCGDSNYGYYINYNVPNSNQ